MALHRSAQGRMVDMASIAAKNEKVRAVGNMNVNARGDVIDSHNRIIQDNTKRVKSSYKNTVGQKPAEKPATPALTPVPTPKIEKLEEDTLSLEEMEIFNDDDEEEVKK